MQNKNLKIIEKSNIKSLKILKTKEIIFALIVLIIVGVFYVFEKINKFELFFNLIFTVSLLEIIKNKIDLSYSEKFYNYSYKKIYSSQYLHHLNIINKGNRSYLINVYCGILIALTLCFYVSINYYQTFFEQVFPFFNEGFKSNKILDSIFFIGFFIFLSSIASIIVILSFNKIFEKEYKYSLNYNDLFNK